MNEQRHVDVNGLRLATTLAGAGQPLMLLHGFTGAAAAWAEHIPALARQFRVLAPDLIGHGASDAPADPARYSIEACVADLLALLDALDAPQAHVLGYSMGGRLALALAAAAPNRVARLVLESASPGLNDAAERAERTAADDALAARIERDGVPAFVTAWERLPLWASQASLPETARQRLHEQRLHNRAEGLANSLRGMGTGRMQPLWQRLPGLAMPVLLLAGELDPKYAALARQMAGLLPHAECAIIAQAGHTIHLEQPAIFQQTVLPFLANPSNE